jgi:ribosomal protein L9
LKFKQGIVPIVVKTPQQIDSEKLAAYLATNPIKIQRSAIAGSTSLYGSVTAADIKAALEESGFSNVSNINLTSAIKTIGDHKVDIDGTETTVIVINDTAT